MTQMICRDVFMFPYVSISQAELSDFSKQWIYGLGCPEVHVGCLAQNRRHITWSLLQFSQLGLEFNTFFFRLLYKALGQACRGFSSTVIASHIHRLVLAPLACGTMKCTYVCMYVCM